MPLAAVVHSKGGDVFVSHGGIGLRTSQMTLDEIENIPRHLVEPFEERSSLLAQVILIRKVIEGGYHSILVVPCLCGVV